MKAIIIVLLPLLMSVAFAADMQPVVDAMNDHPILLNISREAKVDCLQLKAGKTSYTFILKDKFYLSDQKCHFQIKMKESDFNSAMAFASAGKHTMAAQLAYKSLTFGQKLKLIWKCMTSPTCRKYAVKFL